QARRQGRRRQWRRRPHAYGHRLPEPVLGSAQRSDREAVGPEGQVPADAARGRAAELRALLEAVREVPPGLRREPAEQVEARRRDRDLLQEPPHGLPHQAGQVTRALPGELAALEEEIAGCTLCPRLVAWREEAAADPPKRFQGERYWARPMRGF